MVWKLILNCNDSNDIEEIKKYMRSIGCENIGSDGTKDIYAMFYTETEEPAITVRDKVVSSEFRSKLNLTKDPKIIFLSSFVI